MDLVTMVISGLIGAVIFVILEFTVILPLFRQIVIEAINTEMIPKLEGYIIQKTNELSATITKSLFNKMRGLLGGNSKATNAIIKRMIEGEDPEDLAGQYEPSTFESAMTIIGEALPAVTKYINSKENVKNGKKENVKKDQNGLSYSAPQEKQALQ